jgi:hypothetical protein
MLPLLILSCFIRQLISVASMKMAVFWVVAPCSLVTTTQKNAQQPRRQPSIFLRQLSVGSDPWWATNLTLCCGTMTPHFDREVTAYLNQRYENRCIGRIGPIPWPPRSPDLTPLDFILLGLMKKMTKDQRTHQRGTAASDYECSCLHTRHPK